MIEDVYHLFIEFDKGRGFYIGSYTREEEPEVLYQKYWKMFIVNGLNEFDYDYEETTKFWREYYVSPDTQFVPVRKMIFCIGDGFDTVVVYKSDVLNFVNRYIRFRSSTQTQLAFPE